MTVHWSTITDVQTRRLRLTDRAEVTIGDSEVSFSLLGAAGQAVAQRFVRHRGGTSHQA